MIRITSCVHLRSVDGVRVDVDTHVIQAFFPWGVTSVAHRLDHWGLKFGYGTPDVFLVRAYARFWSVWVAHFITRVLLGSLGPHFRTSSVGIVSEKLVVSFVRFWARNFLYSELDLDRPLSIFFLESYSDQLIFLGHSIRSWRHIDLSTIW